LTFVLPTSLVWLLTMIAPELILTFIVASALLALTPGPDNIFVLAQSAVHGRLAGVVITLGLCTGLVFHTSVVALGIATIFQTSAAAFNTLKIIGALYLVYLAWVSFRSGSESIDLSARNFQDLSVLYRRGIVMNMTNPKVSIFFLAFLPQFANMERGALLPQIIILGMIFMVVAMIIFSTIAMLAGYLGEAMTRSASAQKALNKIAGVIFVSLALKLALAER